MVRLSIIVVNYNTVRITLNCLNSVLTAVKGLSGEIIVIDNASTDGSVDKLRKLKTRIIKNKNPSVKGFILIENKINVGFAKAVNQGMKKAEGKYRLLLNSDTVVNPEVISKLIKFAEGHPDAGVVVPQLTNRDGSIQPSVFRFPTVIGAIKEFWLGIKGAYQKYTPTQNTPQKVDSAVAAAFLITPQAGNKVGLFDERYFMYFEDLDFCRRIKKAGLSVYYLPQAKVTHLHGVSGEKISDPLNQWRRAIPSSKIYHGKVKHYLINAVIWLAGKFRIFRQ